MLVTTKAKTGRLAAGPDGGLRRHRRQLLLAGAAAALFAPLIAPARSYREMGWADLAPAGWDPARGLGSLMDELEGLQDDDPRARSLTDRLRVVWDNAPVVPALAGIDVKLPGYVVPLDSATGALREFLLVPYFGSCIHSPPPPANQMLLCRAADPIEGLRSMEAVWVSGRLSIERTTSLMGVVAYSLNVAVLQKQT